MELVVTAHLPESTGLQVGYTVPPLDFIVSGTCFSLSPPPPMDNETTAVLGDTRYTPSGHFSPSPYKPNKNSKQETLVF